MSKAVVLVVALAAFSGFVVGKWGAAAERDAFLESLPEVQAVYRQLEADLDAPSERDVACERIFDLVVKTRGAEVAQP